MREHNEALEASEEYLRIEDELEMEVARAIVKAHIKALKKQHDPKTRARIAELQALAAENPLKAVDTLRGMGFCHTYWYWRKRILKRKYRMVWYTPQEIEPFTCFD